jgi:hypothetical protein
MNTTVQYIGDWGHILAAALFAALSIWTGRRFVTERAGKLLVAALALTSAWLLSIAFGGVDRLESGVMESLRNCGWLVCLFVLPNRFGGQASRQARGARPLYLALALLLVAQSGVDLLANLAASEGAHIIGLADSAIVLRILWAIGALLLTQRIFIACPARVRAGIAPLAAAMTAMWGYDLVLYGAAFFNAGGMVKMLYALRGLNMAALAPVIALSSRTVRNAALQPSRVLAWRGLGVAVGIILALLILSALMALGNGASPVARTLAAAVLFLAVAGTLLFVPATRLHRTAKVLAAKHLFRHRYDYREQWMAFADTLGGDAHTSIHNRALKAMADITQSSCGALLLADSAEDGRFVWLAEWNWKGEHPEALQFAGAQYARMRAKGWITDINEARVGNEPLPLWLAQERSAWALVPLVHFGEQIGLVLLGHPPITRALDWEDFDLLRAVGGQQLASYLAESARAGGAGRGDAASRTSTAASPSSCTTSRTWRQPAQPAGPQCRASTPKSRPFRADMLVTLRNSADKLNALLARLSRYGGGRGGAHRRMSPATWSRSDGRWRASSPSAILLVRPNASSLSGARQSRRGAGAGARSIWCRMRWKPAEPGSPVFASPDQRGPERAVLRSRRLGLRHVARVHPRPACSSPSPPPSRAASASAPMRRANWCARWRPAGRWNRA